LPGTDGQVVSRTITSDAAGHDASKPPEKPAWRSPGMIDELVSSRYSLLAKASAKAGA
jgi:hypothetical protein